MNVSTSKWYAAVVKWLLHWTVDPKVPGQWRSEGAAGPATAGGPWGWRGPPGRSIVAVNPWSGAQTSCLRGGPKIIATPLSLVRVPSGCQYSMRLDWLHRAYLSLQPSGVVHWETKQLNIKASLREFMFRLSRIWTKVLTKLQIKSMLRPDLKNKYKLIFKIQSQSEIKLKYGLRLWLRLKLRLNVNLLS